MNGLDVRTTAVGALRLDGSDTGIFYPGVGFEASTQNERHRAVEQLIRMALGGVGPQLDDDYAILDCYDDEGDIVAEYGIRDARAFRFLYRKFGWRAYRYDQSAHITPTKETP